MSERFYLCRIKASCHTSRKVLMFVYLFSLDKNQQIQHMRSLKYPVGGAPEAKPRSQLTSPWRAWAAGSWPRGEAAADRGAEHHDVPGRLSLLMLGLEKNKPPPWWGRTWPERSVHAADVPEEPHRASRGGGFWPQKPQNLFTGHHRGQRRSHRGLKVTCWVMALVLVELKTPVEIQERVGDVRPKSPELLGSISSPRAARRLMMQRYQKHHLDFVFTHTHSKVAVSPGCHFKKKNQVQINSN